MKLNSCVFLGAEEKSVQYLPFGASGMEIFRRLGKKRMHKYARVEMNHCASTRTITILTLMQIWVEALGAEPGLHGYLG